MQMSFDPHKRLKTLEERNLDFADAGHIFHARHLTMRDDRIDYGEERYITYGHLNDRAVIIVWTQRGNHLRRIISMRHANDRERTRYEAALERHG